MFFDGEPELGPLRARDQVLPEVMARGRALRRRRRALTASPVLAAVVALVAVFTITRGASDDQKVKTDVIAPPSPTAPRIPGPATPGDSGGTGVGSGPAEGTGTGAGTTADTTPSGNADPGPTDSTPNTAPSPFGPCIAVGEQPPSERTCYEPSADNTGEGNLHALDGSRGCTVHNVGQSTAFRDDFHCQYDAIAPGGYRADSPFNLLRIVRNGVTIDIDGMDPNTPRCQPTGFIRPGDHVYIDGRNMNPPPHDPVYSTIQVGDDFGC